MASEHVQSPNRTPLRADIDLTERQRIVLRAVVEDYVISAAPVGSKALVSRRGMSVSSATIRGVMAELEALGLLSHPHTSAGRVPSDLGYRQYVETLMREAELDSADRLMIRHQFSQVELTSNEWLRLAASILATSTRSASVVTPARARRARFGHLQLVELGDGTRLAVLVHADGNVTQRRLNRALLERQLAGEEIGQGQLDTAAAILNAELADQTAPQIRRRMAHMGLLAAHVAEVVAQLLDEADSLVVEDVFTDGIVNVLEQPEFSEDFHRLKRILRAFEEKSVIFRLLDRALESRAIQVSVGLENTVEELPDISVVASGYRQGASSVGSIGLIGPLRMDYSRVIPLVEYAASLLTTMFEDR